MPSTIQAVKADDAFTDRDHGFQRWWPICRNTVGSETISMARGILKPGQRGTLHVHDVDTAIYSISGSVIALFETDGGLQEVAAGAGVALFIPAGLPHAPFNPSHTEDYVYVVARPSGTPD